jgi:hypothetical protein
MTAVRPVARQRDRGETLDLAIDVLIIGIGSGWHRGGRLTARLTISATACPERRPGDSAVINRPENRYVGPSDRPLVESSMICIAAHLPTACLVLRAAGRSISERDSTGRAAVIGSFPHRRAMQTGGLGSWRSTPWQAA